MQSWGCDARNYEGINSIRARPIEVEGVKKSLGPFLSSSTFGTVVRFG